MRPIQLNSQRQLRTSKIHNKPTHRMLTPKPKTTQPPPPQMRPEHPFRIRRTPTHPSCPIPIQPIPRTHPQIVWLPPLTGEMSEAQTPLLPFAPLLLPLPLQGEIKRDSSEATAGDARGRAGLPRYAGEMSEGQRGHSAKQRSQGTPKPAVIPASTRHPGEGRDPEGLGSAGATPVNGGNVPRRVTMATRWQVGQRGHTAIH